MSASLARRTTIWILAGWAALGVLHCSKADADDFYKGKTIKVYIGSGPGGGYDLFGRLVARHIGGHLTGNPAVTPQNMPGAGSILATNYIYNVAPKDGLSLAIGSPSLILIDALQTAGVRFKTEKLNWIGRIAPNINVTVTRGGSAVKTIDDARKRRLHDLREQCGFDNRSFRAAAAAPADADCGPNPEIALLWLRRRWTYPLLWLRHSLHADEVGHRPGFSLLRRDTEPVFHA